MKLIISLLFFFIFTSPSVFATGIEFQQGSLKELMAQAKAENKFIFIDAYTTWCGPCKIMDREVFSNEEVGKFFNENFINAKFDMDMPASSKVRYDYGVEAFPTLLFIDSDGVLIRKIRGVRPPNAFLSSGMEVARRETPGQMNKRYQEGERDPVFLRKYFEMYILLGRVDEVRNEISTYLETQEDLTSESNFSLLFHAPGSPGGRRMKLLLENGDALMRNLSTRSYMNILQGSFIENARKVFNVTDRFPKTELMESAYKEYGVPMTERLSLHYSYLKALGESNLTNLAHAGDAYFMKYPSNDILEVHEFVELIALKSKEPEVLEIGVKHALKSVSLDSKNWKSFALISKCYKSLGKKEKAKMAMDKAKLLGGTSQELKPFR